VFPVCVVYVSSEDNGSQVPGVVYVSSGVVYVSAEDHGSQVPGSPFLPFTGEHGEPLAIWVASAIEKIPPGSLIINPQTGKPYLNPDGSVYRWYPPTDKLVSASGVSHSSPVEHSKVCHRVDCCAAMYTITAPLTAAEPASH